MKNDNQAALDLFSNYSDFMLTDDELLVIHGGTTQSGGASSSSSTASGGGTASAPPAAPPPQAPVQIQPVTTHVNVDVGQSATHELAVAVHEITHEVVDIVHEFHNSAPVQAVSNFIATGINAATEALFGPSGSGG